MGLGDLALSVGGVYDVDSKEPVDIITFIEDESFGLGFKLFPVQRVILKAHYGLELDDNPWGIDITKPVPKDHPNYAEITTLTGADDDPNSEKGYYRWRVKITDYRRENPQIMTEAGYLRYLFKDGRCNIEEVVPGTQRREMILSIGRRSGKSTISACIAAYETYKLILKGNPHAFYGISPSNPIQIISIATSKDQANLLYKDVSGHFNRCKFFSSYKANHTQSFARFQTPSDIEKTCRYSEDPQSAMASLNVTFMSNVAKGLRGAGNIVVILDEFAHFLASGGSSAEEVLTAVKPSTLAFSPKHPEDKTQAIGDVESRIIMISSPLGKQGQFYVSYMQGFDADPKVSGNVLSIQAPTWEVNPTVPAEAFVKEFSKDPIAFDVEYGARFSDRTMGFFEDANIVLDCIDPDLRPLQRAPARKPHFMGIDFGIVNDATAVAIGHLEGERIVTDLVAQIKAGEGDYEHYEQLHQDDIVDWIYDLSRRFFIVEGFFDSYSGVLFEQSLHKRGLKQLTSVALTKGDSSRIWKNLKSLCYERRIVFYDNPQNSDGTWEHEPYIKEMLELQAKLVSKYIVEVHAPKQKGKHDDRPDAVARMAWLATQRMGNTAYIAGSSPSPQSPGGYVPPSIRQSRVTERDIINARRKALRSGSSPERTIPRRGRGGRRGPRW